MPSSASYGDVGVSIALSPTSTGSYGSCSALSPLTVSVSRATTSSSIPPGCDFSNACPFAYAYIYGQATLYETNGLTTGIYSPLIVQVFVPPASPSPSPTPSPTPTPHLWSDGSVTPPNIYAEAGVNAAPVAASTRRANFGSMETCSGMFHVGLAPSGRLQYWNDVRCIDPKAVIETADFYFYSYDVQNPTVLAKFTEVKQQCQLVGPVCSTPNQDFPLPLGRSQKIEFYVFYTGHDEYGPNQSNQQGPSDKYVLNDQIQPYPKVFATGYMGPNNSGLVGFPVPPPQFVYCRRQAGVPPCAQRSGSFRKRLEDHYIKNSWILPYASGSKSDYDAHHIQPVEWGGSNDPGNGVFLTNVRTATNQHYQFTSWWCNFSLTGARVSAPQICPIESKD